MRVSHTRSFPLTKLLAAVSLLAALHASVLAHGTAPAHASAGAPPSEPCAATGGDSATASPRVLDGVGLNYTSRHLASGGSAIVRLCASVDSLGVTRDVRVLSGGTPFDSAAVDAVRWWLFDPHGHDGAKPAANVLVSVEARPPADTDPLVPDVLSMAAEAEAAGDVRGALDAWTGALARVGSHSSLRNEWVIREHILRLAAASPKRLAVPISTESQAKGARNLMQRNIARGANADYAQALDVVLRTAPWYADAYRWRAAARAASGQRAGAMRDVLCYRLAVPDSASRALADRALAFLAVADTLRANSLLKN